jgi:hypothetical protein
MQVHGSCHCGEVSYEAEIDPDTVNLCNCTDCQMLTGTAFRVSVRAPRSGFRLLKGELTAYVKTADSGARRRHSFCRTCGTPVYATADVDEPPTYALRVGCLRERALLPPKTRSWLKSALAWSQNVSGVPGVEGQPRRSA